MSEVQFEKVLAKQLADIEKEKQPDRDLWPGIELALTENDSSSFQAKAAPGAKNYLLVATVAVFGLIGWLSFSPLYSPLTGDALVASLSEQHQQQKNALLVKFHDQPALTQNWQNQLTELDDAAAAIKKALENDQNNMALLKMLQSVHQQQISLIERVHSPKWSQI